MEIDEATLKQQLMCLKAKSLSVKWTQGADATQGAWDFTACKAAGIAENPKGFFRRWSLDQKGWLRCFSAEAS